MTFAANARRCAGVLLCVALLGCATPQTQALRARPGVVPGRVELTQVPFHAQEDYQCGPAALATVLQASGVEVTPDRLVPQVFLPGREGSLQVEMLAATRRHGRLAYELTPDLADLLAEVNAGTPVLVLQNLGLSWWPKWHYAVVVGYDQGREEIVLRSGREARQVISFSTFEHTWARAQHWAMLALPPERLPASAHESGYLQAALDLERTGHNTEARRAYATALSRWPDNLAAGMGLGNSAYVLGDLAAAEQAFRQVIRVHPQRWEAVNNLAVILSDTGRYEAALDSAQTAVRLSAGNPEAEATLARIRRRP